jgi:putative ABC transport system substrate-binding protein
LNRYIHFPSSIKFGTAKMKLLLIIGILVLVSCTEKVENSSHFTIGLITNNPNGLKNVQGFSDKMAELGYIEGKNVTYIFEGHPTKANELDSVLNNMVASNVDLIFTAGTPTGVAAYRITESTGIPVVFGVIADPIAAGVMKNLTNPGGNITGVRISQNQARRLEILMGMFPGIQRILLPYNPDDTAPTSAAAQIKKLSLDSGIEIVESLVRNSDDVDELLSNFPEHIDAIFMLPDSTINPHLARIVEISIDRKIPISGPSIAQVEGGALTAYGIIHTKAGAHAAQLAAQILKGADPGELPVETAEFYLGINLITADAIGIEISYDFLQTAEVIIYPSEE